MAETWATVEDLPEAEIERIARNKFIEGQFPHYNPPSCCQRSKVCCCSCFLLPIRMAIILLILLPMIFVWTFAVKCCCNFRCCCKNRAAVAPLPTSDPAPLPLWRRKMLICGHSCCVRAILCFSGVCCIKVTGLENLPPDVRTRNITVVANHVSTVDTLYMWSRFVPAFVAKGSFKNMPIFGHMLRTMNFLFVDRNKKPKPSANKPAAANEIAPETAPENNRRGLSVGEQICRRQRMEGNTPLIIFPEGTTNNDRVMTQFHSGAFISGEPVYPVVLRYPFKHSSPAFLRENLIQSIVRLLSQVRTNLEVHHLPQYIPSEEEKNDPRLYALNVQAAMVEASALLSGPKLVIGDHNSKPSLQYAKCVIAGEGYRSLLTEEDVIRYGTPETDKMAEFMLRPTACFAKEHTEMHASV